MRPRWKPTERPSEVSPTDFGSDIVQATDTAVLVFDELGRLAFTNPAARSRGTVEGLVSARGLLRPSGLERLRQQAVAGVIAANPRTLWRLGADTVAAEIIPLASPRGWTALALSYEVPVDDDQQGRWDIGLLAHELARPLLQVQQGLEELTQLSVGSPPALRAAMARQGRAVGQLAALVQGLVDLSRAGPGSAGLPWDRLDLGELVSEVTSTYQDLAASVGFRLESHPLEEVPAVEGSRELLTRAVTNLLDNALKYSLAPGPIRVGLRRRGALAVVEVADQGPGIPLSDQQRIFEEFVRLPHLGGVTGGSGLGLAVARRVARAHGGSLSVDSALGRGTTFRLSLLVGNQGPTVTGC